MARNVDCNGRNVVVVIAFQELMRAVRAAVNCHPQEILANGHASDVNPLTIERRAIDVRPSDRDALIGAIVFCRAGGRINLYGVQEAEGLLVTDDVSAADNHRSSVQVKQVVRSVAVEMVVAVTGAVFERGIVDRVAEVEVGIADVWGLDIKAHEVAFAGATNAALDDGAVVGFEFCRAKSEALLDAGGVNGDVRQRGLTLALVVQS